MNVQFRRRGRCVRGVLLATVAAMSLTGQALAQEARTRFNIPSQDAASALQAYARQSGRQVLFSYDAVRGRRAPAVRGEYSNADALARLLSGTGLVVTSSNNSTVTLAPAQNPSGEAQAAGDAADNQFADQVVPEILVRGSRSQNVDVRRTEDDAQPYVVLDHEEIERSQATNLEEFLRERLPMNAQQSLNSRATGGIGALSNASQVNLRGLGTTQTLILVDGRRAPRVIGLDSGGPTFTQADINGIPLAAIDRIEVLPTTAGGIYGGGAVGGVINIIRRRNYNGIDASIGYDGTFRGGGETFVAQIAGGFSPDGGTTQVSFSASERNSRPLLASDNDLWRRGRERFIQTGTSAQVFPGFTTNIQSAPAFDLSCFLAGGTVAACITSPNLVLDNGTPLNSSRTFVPLGYSGFASDSGAGFVTNAGHYNAELSDDEAGQGATLLANPRVRSANLNIRRALTRSVDLALDFDASENLSRGTQFIQANVLIPASAPSNPFRQDVLVAIPGAGLETPTFSRILALSARGTVIAKLGSDWVGSAEYFWGLSRSRSSSTSNNGVIFGGSPTSAATQAFANGSLNPFRDTNIYPLNYAPLLTPGPDTSLPATTREQISSARLAGPLFQLPGGRLTLTALAEYRQEAASEIVSEAPGTAQDQVFPRRTQSVGSGYLGISAPIIGAANHIPAVYSLLIEASVRHDGYSTRVATPSSYNPNTAPLPTVAFDTSQVHSTDFTLATRWEPVRDLALRASYATGFLPPSIIQLVQTSSSASLATILDPRRGNTPITSGTQTITVFQGGNPDLRPEQSRSISVGLVATPRFIPGLRISADYSRISKTGEIGLLGVATLLQLEGQLPGRITRGAPVSTDPPTWAGTISQIDQSLINIARSRVRAWDFQADYVIDAHRFGRITLNGIATLMTEFRRQATPSASPYDSVGFTDGPLEWRGNGGITWEVGNFGFNWNAQYYHSYSVRFSSAPTSSTSQNLVAEQGAERIPSQIYHDISVRYRFPPSGWLLPGFELTAGIQNVFDKRPPIQVFSASAVGNYSAYGDPRLRRYVISLRRHFSL